MAETLETSLRPDGVLHVRLNRPDVHNAFHPTLIGELQATFVAAGQDSSTRAVLLSGNGKSFSAGADIAWMREAGDADYQANLAGAERMAAMFHAIFDCPKPVVASIHGAALGGGTGLAAAVDIAIASETATFGFTEVRLGIVPAVIAPYVIDKVGAAKARALFLTGERFRGREAERIGLVFRACPPEALEDTVEQCLVELGRGGPLAQHEAKRLATSLGVRNPATEQAACAALIARLRGTDEAKEGLGAFLEKRSANWVTQ